MKTLLTVTGVTATTANISVRYDESCSRIGTLVLPAPEAVSSGSRQLINGPHHRCHDGVGPEAKRREIFTNQSRYNTCKAPKILQHHKVTGIMAVTGLTAATAYKAYTMARDDTGNASAIDAISFWTP